MEKSLKMDNKIMIAHILKRELKDLRYELKNHFEVMGIHELTFDNGELLIKIKIGKEKEHSDLRIEEYKLTTERIISDKLRKVIFHHKEKQD